MKHIIFVTLTFSFLLQGLLNGGTASSEWVDDKTSPEEIFLSNFNLFDPAPFNSIIFSQETSALQVQQIISENLRQYRPPCFCDCYDSYSLCVWGVPFENNIRTTGANSNSHSGYKDHLCGSVFGADLFLPQNLLLGFAYSVDQSRILWRAAPGKARLKNYEGVVYGAWTNCPLWIDVSFGYSYDRVHARRKFKVISLDPKIPTCEKEISHKYKSNLYASHLSMIYDFCTLHFCRVELVPWAFFNLDFFSTNQPSYRQFGEGDATNFDLRVHSKNNKLLRPEVGLGFSLYKNYSEFIPFLHTSVSYAKEIRFGRKQVSAHFIDNPDSKFTFSGLFPQNDLICPVVQIGVVSAPDYILNTQEAIRVYVNYRGAFGSKFKSNEIAAELAITF